MGHEPNPVSLGKFGQRIQLANSTAMPSALAEGQFSGGTAAAIRSDGVAQCAKDPEGHRINAATCAMNRQPRSDGTTLQETKW